MCREGLSFITLFMLFIIKRAILFTPQNRDLLEELQASVRMVRRVGTICKTEGFSIDTCKKCQDYIVRYVIGNANNRRAMLGVKMLEYFKKHEMLLADTKQNHKISLTLLLQALVFTRIRSHLISYLELVHSFFSYRYTLNL